MGLIVGKKTDLLLRANKLSITYTQLKEAVESIQDHAKFLPKEALEYMLKETVTVELGEKKSIPKMDFLKNYYSYDPTNPRFYNESLRSYAQRLNPTGMLRGIDCNYYNTQLEQYVELLPQNIKAIKKLKSEVKQLLLDTKNRAPSLFKTGNWQEKINALISLKEVKELLAFAEEVRDNISLHPELFKASP